MISSALLKEKRQIDDLFSHINAFTGDPYDKSLLTFYLCIRVSGFIENCVRIILSEYSIPRSRDQVITFIGNKLKKFPNPTYGAMVMIAKEFDDKWSKGFKGLTTRQHQSSIESININRNQIAHGGTSSITIGDLYKYYQDVVEVIENFEATCK
jgi:hypothetical protein